MNIQICPHCKGKQVTRKVDTKGRTLVCRTEGCGKETFRPHKKTPLGDRFKKSQDFVG